MKSIAHYSYSVLKHILLSMPPELSHNISLKAAKLLPIIKQTLNAPTKAMGLDFLNPIGLAAGFDKNGDYIKTLFNFGFGFLELGTVTPMAQIGNPKPRIFRLKQYDAVINRLGFNNKGVDYLIEKIINFRKTKNIISHKGIIGVSIGKNATTSLGNALDDYLYCFNKAYEVADYIAINISSPNTKNLTKLQSNTYLENIIYKLKARQTELHDKYKKYTPIAIKVSPDLTESELISVINTINDYNIDSVISTNTSNSLLSNSKYKNKFNTLVGGISGKPLQYASLKSLKTTKKYANPNLTIINAGGIQSAADAKLRFESGANLIQIYTGLIYKGPKLLIDIAKILN